MDTSSPASPMSLPQALPRVLPQSGWRGIARLALEGLVTGLFVSIVLALAVLGVSLRAEAATPASDFAAVASAPGIVAPAARLTPIDAVPGSIRPRAALPVNQASFSSVAAFGVPPPAAATALLLVLSGTLAAAATGLLLRRPRALRSTNPLDAILAVAQAARRVC